MHPTENSKLIKKILLHPGEFVIPRRIYRDCKGVNAETMMTRLNELVEEGLGCLVERTQQQTVFFKEIPNPDIEEPLKNHGVEYEDYRTNFFKVDYKCGECQRHAIKMENPQRRLVDRLYEEFEQEEDEEQEEEEEGVEENEEQEEEEEEEEEGVEENEEQEEEEEEEEENEEEEEEEEQEVNKDERENDEGDED
jgi:flagellar biosynthesis GTPase FlhF